MNTTLYMQAQLQRWQLWTCYHNYRAAAATTTITTTTLRTTTFNRPTFNDRQM